MEIFQLYVYWEYNITAVLVGSQKNLFAMWETYFAQPISFSLVFFKAGFLGFFFQTFKCSHLGTEYPGKSLVPVELGPEGRTRRVHLRDFDIQKI